MTNKVNTDQVFACIGSETQYMHRQTTIDINVLSPKVPYGEVGFSKATFSYGSESEFRNPTWTELNYFWNTRKARIQENSKMKSVPERLTEKLMKVQYS